MSVDPLALIGAVGGVVGAVSAGYVAVRRKSIERYVAELNRLSYEHEVVFSRLHERRVAVIADLYGKLVDAEGAFGAWVHPLQESNESQKEKGQAAFDAGKKFQTLFIHNRIWLDADLCDQLDGFNRTLYEAFVVFTTYNPDDPFTKSEHLKTWKEAWDKVAKEATPLRQKIESRFREMLGVQPLIAGSKSGSKRPKTAR